MSPSRKHRAALEGVGLNPLGLAALGAQAWWMWLEAAQVIALRSVQAGLARPGYQAEARRMVEEKVHAGWDLGWRLMLLPSLDPAEALRTGLAIYAPRVSANRRRLSRRLAGQRRAVSAS